MFAMYKSVVMRSAASPISVCPHASDIAGFTAPPKTIMPVGDIGRAGLAENRFSSGASSHSPTGNVQMMSIIKTTRERNERESLSQPKTRQSQAKIVSKVRALLGDNSSHPNLEPIKKGLSIDI